MLVKKGSYRGSKLAGISDWLGKIFWLFSIFLPTRAAWGLELAACLIKNISCSFHLFASKQILHFTRTIFLSTSRQAMRVLTSIQSEKNNGPSSVKQLLDLCLFDCLLCHYL